MSSKYQVKRGYQGRLEDAYSTLENMDRATERESVDYEETASNQSNRSFGKRRDKSNKPQRGGIRD